MHRAPAVPADMDRAAQAARAGQGHGDEVAAALYEDWKRHGRHLKEYASEFGGTAVNVFCVVGVVSVLMAASSPVAPTPPSNKRTDNRHAHANTHRNTLIAIDRGDGDDDGCARSACPAGSAYRGISRGRHHGHGHGLVTSSAGAIHRVRGPDSDLSAAS